MKNAIESILSFFRRPKGYGRDPIHHVERPFDDGGYERGSGWYFWLEDWSSRWGPYETERKARRAHKQYVKKVLG